MKTILQEKETNSLQHYNLVHKFIPMPQAMKIPAAKAAEVRSKKEVIDEARTKGAKVHFASLMDICNLKNARIGDKCTKNTKVELYSEAIL